MDLSEGVTLSIYMKALVNKFGYFNVKKELDKYNHQSLVDCGYKRYLERLRNECNEKTQTGQGWAEPPELSCEDSEAVDAQVGDDAGV